MATKAITKTLEILEQTTAPLPARIEAWRSKARNYLRKVEPWIEQYHQRHGNVAVDVQDLETALELVITGADTLSDVSQWSAEQREQLANAEDELSQAREIMRVVRPSGKVEKRWIWELLLGRDHGTLPMLLLIALLVYNGLRFILTFCVGPLREEEERTGFTPAWKGRNGYKWLWMTHRVASVLFWISLFSALYQFGLVLFTPILVPG